MGPLCLQGWRPCWNACCGNDCEDQAFVYWTGSVDQGDLPGTGVVAQGCDESDPVWCDRVPPCARQAVTAEDWSVARAAECDTGDDESKAVLERLTLIRVYVNSPEFTRHSAVQFLLLFKVDWRQHSVSNMIALRVVEHLDVVEGVSPCLISGFVDFASDAFAFQEVEEALGDGVVVTVSAATHAVFKIVLLQE
jgi:hypothetical protein